MTEPNGTPEQLTDDQVELQRRYSLSDEDARHVQGGTWAEQCEDAERLSKLSEPQSIRERAMRELEAEGNPNAGELSGFAAKAEQHRALIELLHGNPPQGEDSSDGEGGGGP